MDFTTLAVMRCALRLSTADGGSVGTAAAGSRRWGPPVGFAQHLAGEQHPSGKTEAAPLKETPVQQQQAIGEHLHSSRKSISCQRLPPQQGPLAWIGHMGTRLAELPVGGVEEAHTWVHWILELLNEQGRSSNRIVRTTSPLTGNMQ